MNYLKIIYYTFMVILIINLLLYLSIIIGNPNNNNNLYDKHMTAYTRIYAIYYYMYYGSDKLARESAEI